jgi:hypothetical protein
MPEILLSLDERTLSDIEQQLLITALCNGSLEGQGAPVEFAYLVVKSIREGEDQIHIGPKEPK